MDREEEGGMLDRKEDDGGCGRKRRKQLINQHRKETGTAEQSRDGDAQILTNGDRECNLFFLPVHSWLWLAGCRCPLPSPSGQPICPSICLGLRHELKHPPCGQSSTIMQFELPLESKCGYGFVFLKLGVSKEGTEGPVRRNELHTDRKTHLHLASLLPLLDSKILLYKTSYTGYDPFQINADVTLCLMGFERFPFRQEHMSFNVAASSPAALREHRLKAQRTFI